MQYPRSMNTVLQKLPSLHSTSGDTRWIAFIRGSPRKFVVKSRRPEPRTINRTRNGENFRTTTINGTHNVLRTYTNKCPLVPFSSPGVGIILVTISGAAWRITSPDSSQCLGLGTNGDLLSGVGGRRPCSGRGNTPQGLLYPEFQHRPPPPSYQASMQEYRLRFVCNKTNIPTQDNRS